MHSGQYWAFAHYSRAIQRDARMIPSDGQISNVQHIAAVNPDSSSVAVLNSRRAANSTVWLAQENQALESRCRRIPLSRSFGTKFCTGHKW